MERLHLELGDRGYDINIGAGLLSECDKLFDLDRHVLIVTDNGVPAEYAQAVAARAKEARIVTVSAGEGSKSMSGLAEVLGAMTEDGMSRGDCVVAVGGGVVGDLAGFAASCYMRGVDFYNIPTTVLSQVDSSIGGKTAINFGGIKNIVGAFYQPRGVLIDTNVLKTLPKRQISNGLAEAVKMALTSDGELFELFESLDERSIDSEIEKYIEKIITASLKIKKAVVEQDEKESGLRKILNFGHTFGHGVEAAGEMRDMYHGESVAVGMLPMCSGNVRKRLIPVLRKLSLPTEFHGDIDSAIAFMHHDKKRSFGGTDVVLVDEVGGFRIERMSDEKLDARVHDWAHLCK